MVQTLKVLTFSNSCHRPRPPRPPRPRLDPLLPPTSRLKAKPSFPLLANLTAFRTFSSVSSARGSFPIFLWSLSIFASRLRDVFFSCSTDNSVGSNCDNNKKKRKEVFQFGRTFRLTPRIFFSPSNRLSNLPILAVLIFVVASVFSISIFRGPPAARAIFCSRFFSFSDTLFILASRATFRGSWSTSVLFFSQKKSQQMKWDWTENKRTTSICRYLRNPSLLNLFILSISSPPINPILFLFIPYPFLPNSLLNTFRSSKQFPLGRRFGFW